ncbi:MAG: flagellar biosynthesis protein FlhB [bacterium]
MADTGGQEKSEQPTDKRLTETREKGQVAKSAEINSLAIFVTGLLILFMFKDQMGNKISELAIYIFSSLDHLEMNVQLLSVYATKGFSLYLVILAPIFIALVVISLAVGFGQVGFKISLKALIPKFEKLNPLTGIKSKLFSVQPFVETLKAVFKFVVVSLFVYWALKDAVINSLGLVDYSVENILEFMVSTAVSFLWKISIVYTVIAAADFIYQKFKFKKNLMMSKQEVKDEMKQTEGDPLIKGKIRTKQIIMARSRMMKAIPTADVVITNPTHYAVALKYELGKQSAPKVVAKGVDFLAQRIKKIAIENHVPLHEDRELARALYKMCDVGDDIPENLFKTVAQILAYIYKLKTKKRKSIV